jgi:uncharacterized SAM-binding protein YcdF (DUF218 family)
MKSLLKNILLYFWVSGVLLWLGGFGGFCLHTLNIRSIEKIKTEGLVVLTGSPERIPEGLRLFKEHADLKVLISGMNPKVPETRLYKNIPEEAIPRLSLGWTATNTYENAKEVRQWVQNNHLKSVTILTSFYHIPRSLLEIWDVLPETKLVAAPVFSKGFDSRTVWLLFAEYNKTLFVLGRIGLKKIFLFEKG